jgi:hypothetical protein
MHFDLEGRRIRPVRYRKKSNGALVPAAGKSTVSEIGSNSPRLPPESIVKRHPRVAYWQCFESAGGKTNGNDTDASGECRGGDSGNGTEYAGELHASCFGRSTEDTGHQTVGVTGNWTQRCKLQFDDSALDRDRNGVSPVLCA